MPNSNDKDLSTPPTRSPEADQPLDHTKPAADVAMQAVRRQWAADGIPSTGPDFPEPSEAELKAKRQKLSAFGKNSKT